MNLGRQFGVQATLRALVLLASMMLLSYLLFKTDFYITPVVTAALCAGLVVEFVFFVRRTNREVARFFESVRHADFSHRFDPSLKGAGFQELARSMREVVERLQDLRRTGEEDRLRLQALVEHVPVPMFGVIGQERIVQHNHAVRRFFGSTPVTSVDDLERFGPELPAAIRSKKPGQSALVRLKMEDGSAQRMTLSLTEIVVGQEQQRLVTLQNISDELAASELEAWQQMAQVLAHEIMNSLTPVASLADTARELLKSDDENKRAQAQDAIATVAHRAESLMHFVQGYRRFSRLPEPVLETINAETLLHAMVSVIEAEAETAGITLSISAPSSGVQLRADRHQLEQVVINVLHNAMAAVADAETPTIQLACSISRQGRPTIEISDNGPGIPPELRERVFVPYYSTRDDGSGVGLALTRQVMIAHGGTASIGDATGGGARIILRF
ncbi:MAG: ATP-binding protein [Pseudomonadota bacterium]